MSGSCLSWEDMLVVLGPFERLYRVHRDLEGDIGVYSIRVYRDRWVCLTDTWAKCLESSVREPCTDTCVRRSFRD